MKYISKIITTAFVLAFFLPVLVFAQGNDSFQLDTQGNVTLTLSRGADDKISSLQFSLKIDSNSADKVEFQFNSSQASITEFRYDEDNGILNVYIAGTEPLFSENGESLAIGRVVVLDASQNNTPATVSVVADSFQYVDGTELKNVDELQVPGAVAINGASSGSGGSQTPPTVDNSQGSGGSSSGSQGTGNSNNSQAQGNDNADSDSQNTTSAAQSSGSNTSNRQPQSSDNNELDGMPRTENYTRLKQTFENARKLKEEDYSSESYEALQAAMAKAEEVLGDPNAMSEEIDEALLELENAIGALVAKEDAVDDSQQSGDQETGETSGQIVDTSGETEEDDASNGGTLSTILLVVGILLLVGCVVAAAVIKIRSEQNYEED